MQVYLYGIKVALKSKNTAISIIKLNRGPRMIVLEKKNSFQLIGVDISPYSKEEFFYSDIKFDIN